MTDVAPPRTGPNLRADARARRIGAVDAFLDLILEHGTAPTPEAIAERAGISLATFYRYFDCHATLRHEAMTRVLDRYPHLVGIPAIGAGDRADRIERFVAARLELHEVTHPLSLLLRSTTRSDEGAAEALRYGRAALADQVRRHFEAELAALTPARRDDVVTAIATLTSVEGWEQLRHGYDRTPSQVRRTWADALDRLLPAP